ncbi:amino acid adenylation domain-containing protein [Streptomyces sp. MSC1_001]|uniref:amino acid adenylation domain-containing protein n=1 Tax=Streptomyces sp. MSC1_001 TaxID=2909263 RepID=UPI00202F20FA|nr:amino acid adenylation domain-containing protein [Streptomyces sp. MSC1_001]
MRAHHADVAPLALATDHPRLTAREYRGETVSAELPEDIASLLEKVSTDAGVSELVTVLTAWVAVLHRHTARTDLVVVLDIESFDPSGAGEGGGALPLSVRLRPQAPFSEELPRVQAALSDALRTARATGFPALPDHVGAAIGRGGGSRGGDSPGETAADVTLGMEHADRGAVLTLTYNASLFVRTTAVWLLGHCVRLLSEAVAAPRLALNDLRVQDEPPAAGPWDLPTPEDFVPPAPAGPAETLVARFRRTVAAHGSRIALVGAAGKMTYEELDRASSAAARRLARAGAAGNHVALLCAHDVGAVVATWAVLKSGAAYVPLDPRQSDSRLTRLLTDADVSAVLCDPELADRAALLARGRRVMTIDPDARTAGETKTLQDPDALAYLLYTSGSTGKPKAVMQRQRNVLAHALTYATRLRIGAGESVPLLARYTSDAAVMDLFGALLSGATLHVLDPLLPAPELRERLAAAGATVVHCTPTLFRHLLGDRPQHAERCESLRTVRVVVLGGEEATQRDLRDFLGAFPATASLVNGLGPTECTLVLQHMATRDDLTGTTLPVGRCVEGVSVRLLDEDGRPTEVFGELEVLSDRVALGYWNQPDITARAFETRTEGLSYRTGDLARRRADGAVVFQGRKDRQIKIRGYRIEPGEIEAVLRGHPTVAESVVTVDTRRRAPRLVGYVTPATGFPPDTEELTRYLKHTLPDYAVPWRIVALNELPPGPTGKTDHSRLPLPEEPTGAGEDRPTTPLELAVSAIWCGTLGIPSASLNSNFMASGGDSLRLLEMLAKAQEELGVEIPLMDFLAAPTIATMATLIERERTC